MIVFYTLGGEKLGESDFKAAIPRISEEVIKGGESYQVVGITHKLSSALGKCSEIKVTCKLLGSFINYIPDAHSDEYFSEESTGHKYDK